MEYFDVIYFMSLVHNITTGNLHEWLSGGVSPAKARVAGSNPVSCLGKIAVK